MLYCVTHILKSTDHNSIKFKEQHVFVSRVSSSDSESSTQVLFMDPCISLAASSLPPPPLPNFFIETFLQYVRVSGSIVLLVKYNFSINVTTQGSTKWSLTEETLSTMLVNFILKMQCLVSQYNIPNAIDKILMNYSIEIKYCKFPV